MVASVNSALTVAGVGTTHEFSPNGYTLPTVPFANVPPSSQWIDIAVALNDRYTQSRLASQPLDPLALGGGRTGSVRWGQVEIIQMTSLPTRDPTTGAYSYYEQANNARMDPAQLAYLTARLSASTALVKFVVYSRSLSPNFIDRDDVDVYKNVFIQAATSIVGPAYTAAEAAVAFDKIFTLNQAGRTGGNLDWIDNVLVPAIKATGAKNVFFLTAGDLYPSCAYLDAQHTIVEFQAGALGAPLSGTSNGGAKEGMKRGMIASSRFNGYGDITVSPLKRTVTFDMVNVQNEKKAVTFALQ